MQVTETKSEGLRREYAITVGAAKLTEKTNAKLETVRADFQMKGFRKGKAPMPLLKKMFGKSVLGEVVQETVDETLRAHLAETGHRPAGQPDVKVTNTQFDEGDDLMLAVAYDCLPEVPEVDFSAIALERKVVEVDDGQVDEALEKLAGQAQNFEEKEGAAEEGDQVVIDFVGKLEGEPFEGGSAEDYPLVIGSNQFIPGFEEQLTGLEAGTEKAIEVTFPENYGAGHLAGAAAVFEVTVKEVRGPKAAEIDETFAARFGAESVDELKGQIRERIGEEFTGASRTLVKRRLLDALDEVVSFELPPSLVDEEAKSVARQLWQEENAEGAAEGAEASEAPQGPPETIEPTEEHRKLAERRVRLGLLLAEVGNRDGVEITEQEMGQAIMAQARQYPGQEREFFEFVKGNRGAMEQIRAPLFEDKVIDQILEKAQVTEVPVTKEALQEELESLDDA
ncbi:MAG: trigger factor [Pseudomonadota bacterium]